MSIAESCDRYTFSEFTTSSSMRAMLVMHRRHGHLRMNSHHKPLAGQRGLVVAMGSEHGVALLCASRASALGARIVLLGLGGDTAHCMRSQAGRIGAPMLDCTIDDRAALATSVDAAVQRLGGLDFVVHAIDCTSRDEPGSSDDAEIEAYVQRLQISCRSFTELARVCSPRMPPGAALVLLNNLHGRSAELPDDLSRAVHRVLQSIAHYLALELQPWQLRVRAVSRDTTHPRCESSLTLAGAEDRACAFAGDRTPAADMVRIWLEWIGGIQAAHRAAPDHAAQAGLPALA